MSMKPQIEPMSRSPGRRIDTFAACARVSTGEIGIMTRHTRGHGCIGDRPDPDPQRRGRVASLSECHTIHSNTEILNEWPGLQLIIGDVT